MSFPFPKLLAFLEEEKDQVEFMKICSEVGLGASDMELSKLLLALQLYKTFYAKVPREIKAVHGEALAEIRRLRDEVEFLANQAASDALKIGQWAEEINRSIVTVQPKAIAGILHKRLLEETMASVGGSVQALLTAYGQIDTATLKMNEAAYQAATAIESWQALSLRRVWASALCISLVVAFFALAGFWFFYLRQQPWWFSLQSNAYETQILRR